jgi:hypothetical protein
LVLTITSGSNSTAYRITPLSVFGSNATRLYRLRKADGTSYKIAQAQDGSLTCDCADHAYRSRRGETTGGCNHVRAMVACGLLDGRKGGAR